MLKCPFCSFDNEDGALFCEQCKSDLGTPVEASAGASAAGGMASALTTPVMSETIPLAPVAEALQDAASIPMAAPYAFAPEAPAAEAAPPIEPSLAEPAIAEAAPPSTEPSAVPTSTQPKLVVIRGQKIGIEFSIYPGENFIGRTDEKPVDIDLEDQEPPERVWSSRQHACIICDESGAMTLEDLNSSNGTFVNRTRVFPGERRALNANDTIQIGTVHMKVKI